MTQHMLTWCIAGIATAGVIARPLRWPEAVWAIAGAALIVALGLLPAGQAWSGVLKGLDVYMFLAGMMLLSELARHEGLFDWLAALATSHAAGSAARLFALIYAVGAVVTVFLSNDATAVVFTPAVAAATRAAKVSNPLPYLLICAFIANAASFVLPISNPANLVVFGGGHMPTLLDWLAQFALPSFAAIAATYVVLRVVLRSTLRSERLAEDGETPPLSRGGKIAGASIAVTALVLLAASAAGIDLGLPTLLAGAGATGLIVVWARTDPRILLRDISWGVIPLVAGLFVLVEALDHTGVLGAIAASLRTGAHAPAATAAASGVAVAFASNAANNLPVGLVAAGALRQAPVSQAVAGAILIGVDLGPNLSVTGSLATILWLGVLRREGLSVSGWQFLKLGAIAMPIALALSLAALLALG